MFDYLLIGGPIVGLYYYKYQVLLAPLKEKLPRLQEELTKEKSYQPYIDGQRGFPMKFYNYPSLYRLYNIINENRADTLKEAYTLLETQQYQESQIDIQNQLKAMQIDIAKSSRTAATMSTVNVC